MPGSALACCSFAPSSAIVSICFGETSSSVVVATLAQFLRDGQSRKEMSACTPEAMAIFIGMFSGNYIRTL